MKKDKTPRQLGISLLIKQGLVSSEEMMNELKSMTLPELTEVLQAMGEPAFRGKQVFTWLHRGIRSYDEMGNVPRSLREKLAQAYPLAAPKAARKQVSRLDGTVKYLWELSDGNCVESVLMRYRHGNTVCVSTQVGCRMGCRFCASTLDGLERNLTVAELLDQVYRIQVLTGERVSNVVLMGSGEPLDNYDTVLKFLRMISGSGGLNISQRNITLSTCGIVPGIQRLAQEKLQITLALSLHATSDEVRKSLMPVASRYGLKEVLDACREYFAVTGRRMTFEYSLVGGVNDSPGEALALARLLKGMHGHVNLIPVNPIRERDFVQSDQRAVREFQRILEEQGIPATVRREMGRDIQGACGQLRRSFMKENEGG